MTAQKKPLSPEDALKLLDLLCENDAFRAMFATDPASALAQISVEAGTLSEGCATEGDLASKEEFASARARLLEYFSANAVFQIPHCFVSGQVDEMITRKPDNH